MNEEVKEVKPTNEPVEATAGQEEGSKVEEPKLFTQSEMNAVIRKEKEKMKRKYTEEKRLAELSEDDRVREQLKLDREAFENERSEFFKERMNVQAKEELLNNGLPATFTKYVVTDEAESTLQNIKAFKKEWDKALEAAVKERIKSNAKVPKVQTEEHKGNITWEDVVANPKLLPKYKSQNRK